MPAGPPPAQARGSCGVIVHPHGIVSDMLGSVAVWLVSASWQGDSGDPIWADGCSLTPPSPVSPQAGDNMRGATVCMGGGGQREGQAAPSPSGEMT